ncbi:MAG: hypothetical protein M1832_003439 [Thelocarpon impressellum]|nr:MAG: hypothetical protein M1832_003439 [Thelocarpon impressellum]
MRAASLIVALVSSLLSPGVLAALMSRGKSSLAVEPVPMAEDDLAEARDRAAYNTEYIKKDYYVAGITCRGAVYEDRELELGEARKNALRACAIETNSWRVSWDDRALSGLGHLVCPDGKTRLMITHNDHYRSAPDCFRSCRDCMRDAADLGAVVGDCQHKAGNAFCSVSYWLDA